MGPEFGWDMGLEGGIWGMRGEGMKEERDLSWASRLGFGPRSRDIDVKTQFKA